VRLPGRLWLVWVRNPSGKQTLPNSRRTVLLFLILNSKVAQEALPLTLSPIVAQAAPPTVLTQKAQEASPPRGPRTA
jgi:hypothetical protein